MKSVAPWLALVVAALLGWRVMQMHYRSDGELRAKIHAAEQRVRSREIVIAALAAKVPTADTKLRADKQAVASWAARYQRLRDSLLATGEQVPPIILVGDSTIAACSKALATCDSAIAVRDLLLANKDTLLWATDSLLGLERQRTKGFRVLGVPLGCTAGAVASPRGIAPGVGCGVRF